MKKTLLTYCCLQFFAWQAISQLPGYHVRVIKNSALMNPGGIEQILKDDKGFLWLLAPSKVQRYDGRHFRSFSFDKRCVSIQQDAEGVIWLATREAVYHYKNDYTGFEKIEALPGENIPVRHILAGPGKKIYLLHAKGISRWNNTANKFEATGIPTFNPSGSFTFLKSSGDWLYFRHSPNALARYNVVTGQLDSVKVKSPNFLFFINTDSVWVRQDIGSSALVSFNNNTVRPVQSGQFEKKFSDNSFHITGSYPSQTKGELIVFLDRKGYFLYNIAKQKFKEINLFNNGLPLMGRPPVLNFYREESGTVWFANEEGLVHYNPYRHSFGLLRSSSVPAAGNWNNDVRNITEDEKGNIWFATENGFCKWDKKNGSVIAWEPKTEFENYLSYSSIRSIGYNGNKLIVGQSEKGFWIFDPFTQKFSRPQFESDSLKKIFLDDFNGNMVRLRSGHFLILSRNTWFLDKDLLSVSKLKLKSIHASYRTAYEDNKGRLWLAGAEGIYALDNNLQVLYSLSIPEFRPWCNAIVQKDDETFLVAAKHIYEIRLQPSGQLSHRRVFSELKDAHISHLFKDSLGHIWMSSDKGLHRYIPGREVIENFDQEDNVQAFYVTVSNSFRGRDGTVYFGSMNGINYFIPEIIPLQNDSLRVYFTNITVNQDDSSFLKDQLTNKFKYKQNSMVFEFIAPYLYNAEKVKYRYRLDGADKDWIDAGNNVSVRFTSLNPGKYTFYAAASLNGKDWFQIKTPFSFEINPPFWKTWWFIALLVMAIAMLSVLFIKNRIRFIKNREAEKTELQKLRAAGYQTQLETEQIINHFATSMNSVNTVDDILWDVAKNCISKLNFEDCVIYMADEKTKTLVQRAAWGPKTTIENKIINPIEIPLGKGIVGSVALHGKAEIVNDTSLDERYIVDDAKRMSEITVPIINEGKVMGIIDSEHPQKNFYTERHLQILTTIASLCAGKIDKIRAEQQTREKEMELLKLNKDFATSQLTALRMQMNPHFIFNALNSIQQYILQGNVVEANRYLSKFSKLQREILLCSNQNFISMEKEIEILNSYLQLEQLRFGESFSYAINMTDEIDPAEIKIPPMMLQPFVENAIWHGLMPKQGDKNLKIYFDLHTDDILLATIRDNGIGREASAKLKKNNGGSNDRHESKGMSMVHQRLQLLRQQYDKPFEVSVSDITDVAGMVQGTQVAIKIFIGNK